MRSKSGGFFFLWNRLTVSVSLHPRTSTLSVHSEVLDSTVKGERRAARGKRNSAEKITIENEALDLSRSSPSGLGLTAFNYVSRGLGN